MQAGARSPRPGGGASCPDQPQPVANARPAPSRRSGLAWPLKLAPARRIGDYNSQGAKRVGGSSPPPALPHGNSSSGGWELSLRSGSAGGGDSASQRAPRGPPWWTVPFPCARRAAGSGRMYPPGPRAARWSGWAALREVRAARAPALPAAGSASRRAPRGLGLGPVGSLVGRGLPVRPGELPPG